MDSKTESLLPDGAEAAAGNRSDRLVTILIEALAQLWRDRILIALVTLAVTAVAVALSLVLPPSYRSTAVLLPSISSRQSSLSGLSGLSSLIGGRLGQTGVEQLYPNIVRSETIIYEVVGTKYRVASGDSTTLLRFWGIQEESPTRNMEVAAATLDKRLEVDIDLRTGVVTVSALMEQPQLAADVVNRVVALLDDFIRTKRRTTASEERRWIERRLAEVQESLEGSERRLRAFMEQNRQILSPRLTIEQQRLTRDIQLNSSVYIELKNRHEAAQIDEINDVAVITVLDPAKAAARKEKPKRRTIVIFAFLVSLLSSIGYVYMRARYGRSISRLTSTITRGFART